jgi:hypothetical protein
MTVQSITHRTVSKLGRTYGNETEIPARKKMVIRLARVLLEAGRLVATGR